MARCSTCHRRLLAGQACREHGGAPAPRDEAVANAEPPTWERPLGKLIGSGGFAAVWEISDAGGVLKVAHADHELARARLRREAEALTSIGARAAQAGGAAKRGNLCVPKIEGHGVLADGRAWIAMERIAGTNLADLIAAGMLRVSHAIALAIGIADALAIVHAAGWIHRDLKPDNIVRRSDGSIVILDMGLARKYPVDPDDPTRAGIQVGSLEYIPPEQLLDAASVDPRADLYAFGCVLYELCAGRPPFVGDANALERAHAALRPPPLGALAQVPAGLEALCHECLAKQPPRRPATAADVSARMRDVGYEPSLQRQHSMSTISEGKQPVVLLWAELPKVDRTLLAALAARKIVMISQRGRKVLGGVVGAEHADPAGAAIAAARDLAAAGARVALHLEALHITPKAGALALSGPPVEKPETWLPEGTWTGVTLTRAFATVTQAPTRASELGPGFVMLGEAGEVTEMFGREALLADLAADAAAALAGAGPALDLLVGEAGAGKSAFAAALARRLGELGARVHACAVPPPGSGKPGHSALADLIGTPELKGSTVVRAIGDALRAAARAQPTAIIIDDLHLAEHELLDALEYASLGGEALPLWIISLATPRLDQRRPNFGAHAERRRRDPLPALDEDAAVAMTAALMRPAEYPPLRALRQIVTITRGNPMHLTLMVKEIHDRGAIRSRPNGEYFLDTSILDALPPIALGPWLAARELAPLGPELVGLARLCGVLGEQVDRAEVAAVVEAVERGGGATTTIDVEVGLGELVQAGILAASGDGTYSFLQVLLHDGIYATTNEAERRAIHAAALDYCRDRATDPEAAARVARHAEAVGERDLAARAFATLGERFYREHQLLDADQSWSGALRNLDGRTRQRAEALLGRARARARQQRLADAGADIAETLAIAIELGDVELEVRALLENAMTLDLGDQYSAAKEAGERARALVGGAPELEAKVAMDLELAEGRAMFRAGQFADAARSLRTVALGARTIGREEVEITAQLLLAPALVESGAHGEARTVFADLIERCQRRGDRFHLGAALGNRAWLWSAVGEPDRTVDDLREVIQIAREVGHAMLERAATYNLAEDRFWQGSRDEAMRLARRSFAIQSTHGEGTTRFERLLMGKIHAASGERGELRLLLPSFDTDDLSDHERITVDFLRAVTTEDDAAWDAALSSLDRLETPQRLELGFVAARAGRLTGERRSSILELARHDPLWSRRVAEF